MQDINAWLNSDQNYETGLNLYTIYGQSDFIKNLLSAGPTPFNIKKLEAELTKLAPALPAQIENKVEVNLDSKILAKKPSALKDHIRYLELESFKTSLYREIERHMSMLAILTDQIQLHKTAKLILSKHEQLSEIWRLIDYYNETGEFEETPEKAPPTTNRRQRLHVSISKAKKRLASGNCKNVDKTKALIAKLTTELKELES